MFRQIVIATVFVTAVLLAFVIVVQSMRMVEFVVNRGLPSSVVLELLALRVPSFLVVILPISLFVAVLFVYNRLQGESELVIMRSAGLSEFNIARPTLAAALVMMAVAYVNGLYLLPAGFGTFKEREYEYRNAYGSVMLQAGRFNTPTDTLTVYVRERVGARELRGILIRDAREPDNPLTILAERGVLSTDGDRPRVVLYEGSRQEIDHDTGRLALLHFDQYAVSLEMEIPALQDRYRGPRERTLDELFNPGNSPSELQHRSSLIAEGHKRLSDPLSLPALGFIALAFLLPGQHRRRGSSWRVLGAVTVATAYQAMVIGLATTLTKSLVLAPLLYILPATATLIGCGVVMHGLRPRPIGGSPQSPFGLTAQ